AAGRLPHSTPPPVAAAGVIHRAPTPNSAVPQTSPSAVAHILRHRLRHPSLPPVIAAIGFTTGLRQATPQPFAAAGVIHLLSAPVKKTRPQGHSLRPAKVHCNEATFQSSSNSSWLSEKVAI
ncbi:unnamed protein product, partial [Urochloa humidicola]